MKIAVTNDHIERGARCSKFLCPVALAMRQAGCESPIIYEHVIWVRMKSSGHMHPVTPTPEIRKFIKAFDSGEDVEAFTFELPTC